MGTKDFQMSKMGFVKAEELGIKLLTSAGLSRKQEDFSKTSICFIDYTKTFGCVELWKALREMGIPDHLTCLLRNLFAGQEATVRTLYVTTDWLKIEKGV